LRPAALAHAVGMRSASPAGQPRGLPWESVESVVRSAAAVRGSMERQDNKPAGQAGVRTRRGTANRNIRHSRIIAPDSGCPLCADSPMKPGAATGTNDRPASAPASPPKAGRALGSMCRRTAKEVVAPSAMRANLRLNRSSAEERWRTERGDRSGSLLSEAPFRLSKGSFNSRSSPNVGKGGSTGSPAKPGGGAGREYARVQVQAPLPHGSRQDDRPPASTWAGTQERMSPTFSAHSRPQVGN